MQASFDNQISYLGEGRAATKNPVAVATATIVLSLRAILIFSPNKAFMPFTRNLLSNCL